MSGPKADCIVPTEELLRQLAQQDQYRELQAKLRMLHERFNLLAKQAANLLIDCKTHGRSQEKDWDQEFSKSPDATLQELQVQIRQIEGFERETEKTIDCRKAELRKRYGVACERRSELVESKRALEALASHATQTNIFHDISDFLIQPLPLVPEFPESPSRIQVLEQLERDLQQSNEQIVNFRNSIAAFANEQAAETRSGSESLLAAKINAKLDTMAVLIENETALDEAECREWIKELQAARTLQAAEDKSRKAEDLLQRWASLSDKIKLRAELGREIDARLCRLAHLEDQGLLQSIKDRHLSLDADHDSCISSLENEIQKYFDLAGQRRMTSMRRNAIQDVLGEMGYVLGERSHNGNTLCLIFDQEGQADDYGVMVFDSENTDAVQFQVVCRKPGAPETAEDVKREKYFCHEYGNIQQRMQAKGFVQSCISHVPAGELSVATHLKKSVSSFRISSEDHSTIRNRTNQNMRGLS